MEERDDEDRAGTVPDEEEAEALLAMTEREQRLRSLGYGAM